MSNINLEKLSEKRNLATPAGCELIHLDEVAGSAIYNYVNGINDVLYVFFRKSTKKPLITKNNGDILTKLKNKIADIAKLTAITDKQKAERKEREKQALKNHPVKVGSVFCWTFSYEYTRRHYYQVVSIDGLTVEIRPIHGESLNETRTSWDTVPAVDSFSSDEIIKTKLKASCYHQTPHFSVAIKKGLTADLLTPNEKGDYEPLWNTID